MSGATLARRFPSAVRSDRVAPAVKPKLPGDPPLRRCELPRALVVIHQHRQLPVGSIPSSPQFVPPGRLLGRRVHRWPLRATSSIAPAAPQQKGLINDLLECLGRVFHHEAASRRRCGKVSRRSPLLVSGAGIGANDLDDRRVCEGGDIAKVAPLGNVAQEAAHDLP